MDSVAAMSARRKCFRERSSVKSLQAGRVELIQNCDRWLEDDGEYSEGSSCRFTLVT